MGHSGTLKLHNILIHGGVINATGVTGSGIGCGYSSEANILMDRILISNGRVTARSVRWGSAPVMLRVRRCGSRKW
jgi:hypothetical protein